MDVSTLESAEKTLSSASDLLDNVVRQNDQYPGAGATKGDLAQAKTMLGEMVEILSELTSQLPVGVADDQDPAPPEELQQAFNKAASLISRLYLNIRDAHTAMEGGTTQSPPIEQADIHLKRLVQHCRHVREHLLAIRDCAF